MPVEMACKVIMGRRRGLELLSEAAIQESMEYPGNSRTVPATQEAIDALEKTKLDNGWREDGSTGEPCAICLEEMNLREVEVASMPCKHEFHHDCLARWLTMSNMCPLCRFAMPTSLSDVD
ncbi:E3 ubiquitin-protein ligase RING1-like [Syzygium oleosum]|uniref:E3 ubiquitin-protein ligase RING1-like n=2 Tax=Syzygium oleosum TaxID=219896 RepID=UPI0024BA930F|nr:E3 ubiquitin-protein ligase RING1-like [Syzygium oleosum]